MKVLWICNVVFPEFGKKLGISYSYGGGWMKPFYEDFKNDSSINLTICTFKNDINNVLYTSYEGIEFYIFPRKKKFAYQYDSSIEKYMYRFLKNNPQDLIHIWGTEFSHTLSTIKVCNQLNLKSVISIQGLISICGRNYLSGIDLKIARKKTIRDLVRNDSILNQQHKFHIRGHMEIESIKNAKEIIGRTDWDYANVMNFNKNIQYHFCNECLRKDFYDSQWEINNIERYSLFVSQGNYPIKGLHQLIKSLFIVKKRYSNVKLYVAGGMKLFNLSKKEVLRQNYYERYLLQLIKHYQLQDNIVFLSSLDEKEMIKYYLNAHIFVSPSSMENSSNSVGEAMLLGVPVISSFVGGIPSMITHRKEGLLYPFTEIEVLAQYIIEIFENDNLTKELSINARHRAKKMFDYQTNIARLKEIYRKVICKE